MSFPRRGRRKRSSRTERAGYRYPARFFRRCKRVGLPQTAGTYSPRAGADPTAGRRDTARKKRSEKGNAHISIGADKYFLFTDTLIDYDDIDLKKLENDSEYAADLIVKCLTTSFNYKNFLEELSLKQLAKFLDMTKVIVR